MSAAFARVNAARTAAARTPADAGFRPGPAPAGLMAARLRPSQQPAGPPIRGAVIPFGGLRPSRSGSLGGAAGQRIQRCGIGSTCACSPRDKLAGIDHDLHHATAGGGTPLPAASRERMERAFSADFAEVRVHTGAAAHEAAAGLAARALTAGTDIMFRAGEYQPGTPAGDRLLAHELAHVVQQAHGLPHSVFDTGPADRLEQAAGLAADHASPAAEREAHGAAMIAAMGQPVPVLSRHPTTIARQDADTADSDTGDTTALPQAADALSGGHCHTCQLGEGLGICCSQPGAANAPNFDQCDRQGSAQYEICMQNTQDTRSCQEQWWCHICQCIGNQYCQCTGMV